MDDAFYKELQDDFLRESLSLIERFESVLLNNTDFSKDLINELFRIAHSIKGGAAAVGLTDISKFTHEFEDYLSQFRSEPVKLNKSAITLLLEFSDTLRNEFLAKIAGLDSVWAPEKLLSKLKQSNQGTSEASEASAENESEVDVVVEVKAEPASNVVQLKNKDLKTNDQKNKKNAEQVKVDLNRLESIFDTIGEVVIFKNQIKGLLKKTDQNGEATTVFDQMELVIKDLYDKALGLRMTTLQPLFQRLQRTLRDLSMQLDKNVLVKTSGEETEIDRNLFEQLPDPLVHLIRNAIDHGIETKEERLASQKPAQATIQINSYYESGQVIIEIKDDGRGIDQGKVFEKALQKNLISPNSKITDFTNEQINNFIFLPGFSTANQVSDLSGRGVGLDVVKTTIEKFHGQIQITSQKGSGSCFKLCLPLTTSLIDGITFQTNDLKFIIPNNSILSIDTLKSSQISVSGDNQAIANCFDKPLLCIDLSKYYSTTVDSTDSSVATTAATNQFTDKVCVRSAINNQIVCFLFDKVLSQCQVVVKPLPLGNQSPDFIGSAINDEGHVQLILDLASIYKNYFKKKTEHVSSHQNQLNQNQLTQNQLDKESIAS